MPRYEEPQTPRPGVPATLQEVRFVNLCAHPIRLLLSRHWYGVSQLEFEPSGTVARVVETRRQLENIRLQAGNGSYAIPIHETEFTQTVIGLPDRVPGVMYIVSRVVAEVALDRDDLVFPDDSVRMDTADSANRHVVGITGCRSFAKAASARLALNLNLLREIGNAKQLCHTAG